MKRVVADHFCGPYVGGTASDQHTQSWISVAEAARLIGVRAERVVDAVSAGQIEGKIDHSGFGHRHTMIPRCVVENIKAERMDVLDKTKTREALEISKNQYSLLEEAGVLKETKPKAHGALIDGEHSQHALEKTHQKNRLQGMRIRRGNCRDSRNKFTLYHGQDGSDRLLRDSGLRKTFANHW